MSDTPETDAFREVIFAQYKEDELTGDGMGNILAALTDIETLERKRECECKCDVDWPEEYYELRQRLERERDEAREESAKWHGMAIEADKRFVESVLVRDEESKKSRREHDLANEAIATWKKIKEERDALQEQLDAAIILGKMQERRHQRELEQVREQYRLSSVCRKLLLENQQLKESRQSPTTEE